MSLDTNCLQFIGKRLYVEPEHWWYSCTPATDGSADLLRGGDIESFPLHFRLEWLFTSITHFYVYQHLLRGGVGRIEQAGDFDGMYVVFYTLYGGHYDFTDYLGRYLIMIGPERPRFVQPVKPPYDNPDCRFGGATFFKARGQIAESEAAIQAWNRAGRPWLSYKR